MTEGAPRKKGILFAVGVQQG